MKINLILLMGGYSWLKKKILFFIDSCDGSFHSEKQRTQPTKYQPYKTDTHFCNELKNINKIKLVEKKNWEKQSEVVKVICGRREKRVHVASKAKT